ncbi:MAG TPA: hypothetical protein VIL57_06950 [Bacteroidia bacterium]
MKNLFYILNLVIFIAACGNNKEITTVTEIAEEGTTLNKEVEILQAGEYELQIEETESFAETDIFGDKALIDSLIKSYEDPKFKPKHYDTYYKDRFGQYFYNTDSALVVILADGSELKMEDNLEDGDSYLQHSFHYYFPEIDYYLIDLQLYEGFCSKLINRKNGKEKIIFGKPYLSLDKSKIVCINSDLVAGFTFNGIELYTIKGDSLQTEFVLETEWGPSDLKWLNENQFLLKVEYFSLDEELIDYKLVTIKKK